MRVQLIARHPLPAAIVAVAVALVAGSFVVARPQYRPPSQGETIKVPPEHGANGWTWADGTPGWKAGTMVGKHHDFNISGVQPVEIAAAQLAAAHALLDADGVRVLDSVRVDKKGPLAILAAPQVGVTPAGTCLAVMLRGHAPVTWRCPQDLVHTHVIVGATAQAGAAGLRPLFLVGVARGDVRRIVLESAEGRRPIYTKGTTWGQFDVTTNQGRRGARLLVYGKGGLVESLTIDVAPGSQRVFE